MFIVEIKRTPICKFLGGLAHLSAPELMQPLFEYFLHTYPFLKDKTDEVIIGNVVSAGIGMNPARLAAIRGGVDVSVPAYTVNQVCASGMTAIIQAFRAISLKEANLVLAGGMESMSQAPYLLKSARKGMKFGSQTVVDSLEQDGLFCSLSGCSMGMTAEHLAKVTKISREDQDAYALGSHQKAIQAQHIKHVQSDIVAVGECKQDECPRADTSLEKLARLKPVFKQDGCVTAGNASSMNDGAALALIVSEQAMKKYDLKPKAKILDAVMIGIEPENMGMGAALAVTKLLEKNSLSVANIDVFEINEAFAVQTLAVIRHLKLDPKKVNMFGGAIALGHPIGMSGTRVLLNLITALKHTKGKLGVAAVCVGGGQGVAILVELV